MLYYAGYLTHDEDPYATEVTPYDRATYGSYVQSGDAMRLNVRIPNKEVFRQWIDWLQISSSPALNVVLDALLNGDLNRFHDLLADTVIPVLSFHDVRAENFYHGYMLGWLACARFEGYSISTGCSIRSNREGGLGRNDAIIEREREAVIMEYKVRNQRDTKTGEERAKEALSQIEDKKYHFGISNEVQQLVDVGIAFQGKTVAVVGKVYEKKDGRWVEKESARYG
jgi:hypothetical protein